MKRCLGIFSLVLVVGLAGCKPKTRSSVASSGLKFCAHQSQTKRGTALYVVTCGETNKIAGLKTIADCGARVVGSVSPDELLVETAVYALAKIYTNRCFSSVREWTPREKIAAGFAEGEATVTALTATDRERLVEFLKAKGVTPLDDSSCGRMELRAKLTAALVKELAAKGEVRRIAP